MNFLAALLLPERRREDLPSLSDRLVRTGTALASAVERREIEGRRAVVALLRGGADPLNPLPQPIVRSRFAGVACGYYLSPADSAGDPRFEEGGGEPATAIAPPPDSAHRLVTDLAAHGPSSLERADGVYAFALWDGRREELVCGVDKLGLQPLFVCEIPGGGFAVASRISALVPLLDAPRPNWAAWEELIAFGDLFGDHTVVEGVRRLEAAEILTLDASGSRRTRVEAFLEEIEVRDTPVPRFLEENAAALEAALRRCRSVLPPGMTPMLTLSGGYDSRRLLGALTAAGEAPEIVTVPLVAPDGSETESRIAIRLARKLGLPCSVVFPKRPEEETGVREARDLLVDFESGEHLFAAVLALALGAGSRVNFDGFGGDVFVDGAYLKPGYFRSREAFEEKYFGYRPRWLKLPATDPPLHERLRRFLARFRGHPHWVTLFYFHSHSRRGTVLAPLAVQGASFPSLLPYVDRDFVRSGLRLPPEVLGPRHLQREAIARQAGDLLGVPTAYDGPFPRGHPLAGTRPEWRVDRRLRVLRAALAALPERPLQRLPVRQRWLLAGSAVAGRVLPPEFLRWQMHKADLVRRLARQEELLAAPGLYLARMAELSSLLGTRGAWIERL